LISLLADDFWGGFERLYAHFAQQVQVEALLQEASASWLPACSHGTGRYGHAFRLPVGCLVASQPASGHLGPLVFGSTVHRGRKQRIHAGFVSFEFPAFFPLESIKSCGLPYREDEHHLIAQYCRSLNGDVGGSSMNTPRSPAQLVAALDNNHKEEIETMIRYLNLDFDLDQLIDFIHSLF
jgi:hypothetical protein